MNSTYKIYDGNKTFRRFSENAVSVWNGVLKEYFVLNLANNAEIQGEHIIVRKLSELKNSMEIQINWKINVLSYVIEASFKLTSIPNIAKEDNQKNKEKSGYETTFEKVLVDFQQDVSGILKWTIDQFSGFLENQGTNKYMYQKWKERCISELEDYKYKQKKPGDTLWEKFYTHKLSRVELSDLIKNSRVEVASVARQMV